MSESKADLTDRWRREGREKEVAQFRERVREECRKNGLSRREANQTAWSEAAEAFPPNEHAVTDPQLPGDDPFRKPGQPVRPAVPEDFQDNTPPSEAMEWAVTAVGVHAQGVEVKQSDAPGPFAWALFAWGKKNFEKLVAMFRSETSKRDNEDAIIKATDKQNEEIYEMLKEHLEDSRRELARLKGETP